MPITVNNEPLAVSNETKEPPLTVRIPNDVVKLFCNMQGLTYYPHYQYDEEGNVKTVKRSDGRVQRLVNRVERAQIAQALATFISITIRKLAAEQKAVLSVSGGEE